MVPAISDQRELKYREITFTMEITLTPQYQSRRQSEQVSDNVANSAIVLKILSERIALNFIIIL